MGKAEQENSSHSVSGGRLQGRGGAGVEQSFLCVRIHQGEVLHGTPGPNKLRGGQDQGFAYQRGGGAGGDLADPPTHPKKISSDMTWMLCTDCVTTCK